MFITNSFLLSNDISKKLYKSVKDLPIYDYHCHLEAKDIYLDEEFKNITSIILKDDHYKYRLMRANRVKEEYITGDKSNLEKFKEYAFTIKKAIFNPLYHWTALEFKKYFNINDLLSDKNYIKIYNEANEYILKNKLSTRKIINMSNVELICTTDYIASKLIWHEKLKEDKTFKTKVIPGFRPDELFYDDKDSFNKIIFSLEKITNNKINSYNDLIKCLRKRIKYFESLGSNISDHGLSNIYYAEYTKEEIEKIFLKMLKNEYISYNEYSKYMTSLLVDLAKEYKKRNWVMQIHFGAIRNNNNYRFKTQGRDKGYDSINDLNISINLNLLLNKMKENGLPKTIIYNLDSTKNDIVMTCINNFQDNFGNIQLGAAWWFNDTKEGILKHLKTISNQHILANFVGMLTDSRSYLSYVRHDYFRRILCDYIGKLVLKGEAPNDLELLEEIVKDISYYNAKKYFEEI